ncbi:tRNA-specific 2-thiouridylase MnmA [Azospirillaceae bacterium]
MSRLRSQSRIRLTFSHTAYLMSERIVIAMSGGVDSSTTAALLQKQGYDVVGVTLQLYDHGAAIGRANSCCAGRDILDARRVAEHLGIPHYVLDYEDLFRRAVIDDFVDAYLVGETPNPCVRCNQRVKFAALLDTARDLGATALATGHYARQISGAFGPELHCGSDPARDQSYFLFATPRERLAWLRFPLGERSKSEIRAMAEQWGLPVARKPDSQDICFVPDGDYASVVTRLRPDAEQFGDIVHLNGEILGRHRGVIHYTIGQRKRLGIGGRKDDVDGPLFVVALDPATRRVIVGPRAALGRRTIMLHDVNWLGDGDAPIDSPFVAMVKTRSTRLPVPATVILGSDGGAQVELNQEEEGIAAGQACVFYQQTRILGGGWISSTHVF